MAVESEVLSAVGGLAIETTWLEYLAARLVATAGRTDNEMALLAPRQRVFKPARDAAAGMRHGAVRARTLAWLERAETLREERDRVVHSIVLHDGRPGWHGYHPRSGSLRRLSTPEIVSLAEQTREHVDDGVYLSIFEWPPVLAMVESDDTDSGQTPTQPT
jgi:hypothetical protein